MEFKGGPYSGGNSQAFSACQQGFDYPYGGYSSASGYPYGYSAYGYINSTNNVNNSGVSSLALSNANSTSPTTYQLTQLPQQTGRFCIDNFSILIN